LASAISSWALVPGHGGGQNREIIPRMCRCYVYIFVWVYLFAFVTVHWYIGERTNSGIFILLCYFRSEQTGYQHRCWNSPAEIQGQCRA
jgi:hypothetical protein